MRILHVGWGFSPWREGGLITYVEDLMAAQVQRGHDVAYFLSGRHYPYLSGPRLKRWRRHGVAMHEVINPPIVAGMEHGTRDLERELSEPRTEAAFRRVLDTVRPDLVHIQELHGLPSSLIEVAAAAGVPTAMTLHDYGPLCATLRLFDADGRICTRRDVGADCVARNSDAPLDPGVYVGITIMFEITRARKLLGLGSCPAPPFQTPLLERMRWHAIRSVWNGEPAPRAREWSQPERRPALEAAFQRRRAVNVERLGKVGRLIAQSPRLAEIYRELGVADERMSVLPGPASHIERLQVRTLEAVPSPVTFGTLNGSASASKGSLVLVAALRALRTQGLEGAFRLLVFGSVDEAVREELLDCDGVELRGPYRRDELDALLDEVDVGLMPSMWEEAYGYTGLELIAKGIPLIANPLGGILEYAQEGRTAWLNDSCSGEGLAELMAHVIREPERVVLMHRGVVALREELIPPWNSHLEALAEVYRGLVAAPIGAG